MTKRFKLNINLDDTEEMLSFTRDHLWLKGRILANRLGIRGKGSSLLATALSNYAWNKLTAYNCRNRGNVESAQQYERICDKIYEEDILPVCDCW